MPTRTVTPAIRASTVRLFIDFIYPVTVICSFIGRRLDTPGDAVLGGTVLPGRTRRPQPEPADTARRAALAALALSRAWELSRAVRLLLAGVSTGRAVLLNRGYPCGEELAPSPNRRSWRFVIQINRFLEASKMTTMYDVLYLLLSAAASSIALRTAIPTPSKARLTQLWN